MVDSRDISPDDLPSSSDPAEVSAAKRTVSTLVAALRNFGLFPLDHTSTSNMLGGVHKSVVNFVEQFGDLCFEINKTKLMYDDNVIHDDGPAANGPHADQAVVAEEA